MVVSAHASPSDRKPAFFSVIAASVFNRSRVDRGEPVKPRHHHHVAGGDFGEKPAKLRPVGPGSARHFTEHCGRPGGAKLAHNQLPKILLQSGRSSLGVEFSGRPPSPRCELRNAFRRFRDPRPEDSP